MKKLYEVIITMMVMAENKEDAEFEASRADIDACDVDIIEASSYLTNWANALPFGSDDNRTCKEIFEGKWTK